MACSGGIVLNYHWHGDVAIDLSGLRKAPGEEVPVLAGLGAGALLRRVQGELGRVGESFTAQTAKLGLRGGGE